MINKGHSEPDITTLGTSTSVFIQYYNENIPETFPQATIKALNKFRASHSTLFKNSNEWVIEKHRKKLMDWLSSYKEEA